VYPAGCAEYLFVPNVSIRKSSSEPCGPEVTCLSREVSRRDLHLEYGQRFEGRCALAQQVICPRDQSALNRSGGYWDAALSKLCAIVYCHGGLGYASSSGEAALADAGGIDAAMRGMWISRCLKCVAL
jgi:hypothetical protein